MNGFDYRITASSETFYGHIVQVLPGTPGNYCAVRLHDGRVLRFVKYLRPASDTEPLSVGERVTVERNGGLWAFRSRQ